MRSCNHLIHLPTGSRLRCQKGYRETEGRVKLAWVTFLLLLIFVVCFTFVHVRFHIFSFTKSRSLKTRYHVPSTVEPGKDSLTSILGFQQLDGQIDQEAAAGISFISCTTLGVRSPVTFIVEFP